LFNDDKTNPLFLVDLLFPRGVYLLYEKFICKESEISESWWRRNTEFDCTVADRELMKVAALFHKIPMV